MDERTGIRQDIYQEALRIIELQDFLVDLTENNLDDVVKWISTSPFANTDIGFLQLLENTIIHTGIRPAKITLYGNLFTKLFIKDGANEFLKSKRLELLHMFFHPMLMISPITEQSAIFRFLHELYLNNFFTIPEFTAEYTSCQSHHPTNDSYLLHVLLWFAPDITAEDKGFLPEMREIFQAQLTRKDIPSYLGQYFSQLSDLFKDNYAQLREYIKFGCLPGSLTYIIKYDDIEAFEAHVALHPDINLDSNVEYGIFMDGGFLTHDMTMMQLAALYRSVRIFKYLLLHGCSPRHDTTINSVMQYAIAGGNYEILNLLKMYHVDCAGIPQLAALFHRNDFFMCAYTANGYDINRIDSCYSSILHQCADTCNIKIMLFAFAESADVNIRDTTDMSPLCLSVEKGHYTSTKVLLAHPMVKANVRDTDNETPLFYAANGGFDYLFDLFSEVPGLDPNIRSVELLAPLHKAALDPIPACVSKLLAFEGIEINIRDASKYTPLHYAAQVQDAAVLKLLLKQPGIEVNPVTKDGHTPLNIAVESDNLEAVRALLAYKGVEVNHQDDTGETPLHAAAVTKNVEIAKLLLSHPNIHVNIKNKVSFTALHNAVTAGSIEIVRLLVAFPKVDLASRTKNGKTAYDMAVEMKDVEIQKILKSPR